MNKYFVGSAVLVTLLGLYVRQGSALLCWDCNSALDPRCADGHFDPYTLASVDCGQMKLGTDDTKKVPFCRKVKQVIGFTERTVRSCGWLNETKEECYSKTGTKDITITYCHCNEDNCNGAGTLVASLGLSGLLLLLTKIF